MFGCATDAGTWSAECGQGVQVQNQTARFDSVQPDSGLRLGGGGGGGVA